MRQDQILISRELEDKEEEIMKLKSQIQKLTNMVADKKDSVRLYSNH